jgi:hypothetical protein
MAASLAHLTAAMWRVKPGTLSARAGDAARGPDDLLQSSTGGAGVLRVGDEDVTGGDRQDDVLRIGCSARCGRSTMESGLSWNVTAHDWPVPIRAATVAVQAPRVAGAWCWGGELGSAESCSNLSFDRLTVRAGGRGPESGEGLTVDVEIPPGAVAAPPPVVRDVRPPLGTLPGDPTAVAAAALLTAAVAT